MPNQYTKAKETGVPYIISDETRKKLSDASKKTNARRWSSKENREKQSISMKRAVENHPESYSSSNRGRTKQIIFDNIKFQGKWELDFYKFCKQNNIAIIRSNEWFEYEWNGTRKYFPDFYLPEYDLYVEVKGYETERDLAKWSAFPKKLKVVKKEDIKSIRENTWALSSIG